MRGFSIIIVIVLVLVALLILLLGVSVFRFQDQNRLSETETASSSHNKNNQETRVEWPTLWGSADNQNKCQPNQSVKYTVSPLKLEDTIAVEPIGELQEGHIIPGDHGGFNYQTSPTSTPVAVYVPADGYVVGVEKHPYTPPTGYPAMKHYHVYLEHSCTLFTGFVHLTEFTPEILAESPELKRLDSEPSERFSNIAPRIPVKAGAQLGTAWSFGLLGMLTVDLTHTNKGYLNPQSYRSENWRVHSVGSLDYFENSIKTKMLTKNPRVIEPRGGKIDHDIAGKAVGNWFLEGSGGLRDDTIAAKQCGNFPCPYWEGHLALVYDFIDPPQLRLSVGYDSGLNDRTPYGIKGNSPDFKDVGVTEGLVKYEIVALKDVSMERGYDVDGALIRVNDETKLLGTMLVQMTDNDTLKMEIFPGKTKEQINEFTIKARVYKR